MMEIRFLTADDAAEWWRLRLESLERDPEAFSASAEDHQSLKLEDVRSRLGSGGDNFFVAGAFEDGRLAAMAGFHREQGVKTRHKGRVWGVYVTPSARGRRVGRKLMLALLERAAGIDDIEQILISVTTTQMGASSLYRSLGFERFGREPRAMKVEDRYIDEDLMVLLVDGRHSE
jgi:ribosomal protein S18 acetylase RimI-like enzyme